MIRIPLTLAALIITSTAHADCIDINNATPAQLTSIIHIDAERAREIVARRPFVSVDGLDRVPGIARKRLADISAQGLACVKGTSE